MNNESVIVGLIKLKSPKKLSIEEFKNWRQFHQVTDNERETWFPKSKAIIFYDIASFYKFKEPKKINLSKDRRDSFNIDVDHIVFQDMKDYVENPNKYDPVSIGYSKLLEHFKTICKWHSEPKIMARENISKDKAFELAMKIIPEMSRRNIKILPTEFGQSTIDSMNDLINKVQLRLSVILVGSNSSSSPEFFKLYCPKEEQNFNEELLNDILSD